MTEVRTITKIALLILIYYITYALYNGILNPIPALGDSWAYHIPISQTILNGSFLNPVGFKIPPWYYPGSAEAINSLFILLHIPLTLSNLFAAIVLFFTCWKLALTFKLDYYYSLLFGITIVSLNVIVRWFNAVSIDIWVAVFFCWAIILLESPKKTITYFAKLGFVFGMLIGSKYTALLLTIVLLIIYWGKLVRNVNAKRFLAFLIPFSLFGLFWYIRNYISISNPFYPLEILGFQGADPFTINIFDIAIAYPLQMFNALFGEYKLWSFVLLVPGWYAYWVFVKKKKLTIPGLGILTIIGFVNFLLFLKFPTSNEEWIMVSSFRYSYPIFIPLILTVFLLANKYHLQNVLGYFVIANMITVLSFSYFPKLIIFFLPLSIICFYFIDNHAKREKRLVITKKIKSNNS